MVQVVILLGAPGAGKGTQAVRLSETLSLPHVSTGDMFREHLSSETELGCKVKEYLDRGHLVPDELVFDMLFDRVSDAAYRGGYLLDGFPRTVAQAETLDDRLDDATETRVLLLDVPDEVIIERAEGRLTCAECGRMYHRKFSPPASEGVCDACGGELRQRKDDSPAVVRERLGVYHEQTQPVVDYYSSRERLCVVDGDQDPDRVFEACLTCVR